MNGKLPVIAIVGRPNVGKSSLFNRLINRRLAITSEIAGTTRDRIYHRAEIAGQPVIMVDTGGIEYGKKDNIEADVQSQVKIAVSDADLILFMVDAKDGLTIEDYEAAKFLRKSNKKILLIANKIDSKKAEDNIEDCKRLGFGVPMEVSVYHNLNMAEIDEKIVHEIKMLNLEPLDHEEHKDAINLCFLGKPNVGKSSLVNAILGKSQVIVSNIPGTTRDTIDTEFSWQGKKFNLIDTAGLRRRGKIERGIEKISTLRSLSAVERADVVCLILDYDEGIRKQDQHISAYILEAGKGLILVVNKSDLMSNREYDEAKTVRILKSRFDFLPWAPVVFTSALEKKNLEKILEVAALIHDERKKRIDDDELDGFMKEITHKHLPPPVSNKLPKFYSLKQDGINPPSFVYWVNDAQKVHFSYKRYLENELRKKYGYTGTAVKIYYKSKKEDSKRKRVS